MTATHSHIQVETMAVLRGEPPGAAMRKACEDFEVFWLASSKRYPKGVFLNQDIEETCKRIARLAFLEGRGL